MGANSVLWALRALPATLTAKMSMTTSKISKLAEQVAAGLHPRVEGP